jgi:hypothetical protein
MSKAWHFILGGQFFEATDADYTGPLKSGLSACSASQRRGAALPIVVGIALRFGGNVTEEDIVAMCEEVDAGKLSVEMKGGETWDQAYSGHMRFRFGNGTRIIVFNDCGEWDYIELIARKIFPSVSPAADIHSSTAFLTHWGIGTVRMRPPLPARSTTAQCS